MRQVDAQVEHKWLVTCFAQERFRFVDMYPVLFVHLSRFPIAHRLGNRTGLLAQGKVDGSCPRFNALRLGVPA